MPTQPKKDPLIIPLFQFAGPKFPLELAEAEAVALSARFCAKVKAGDRMRSSRYFFMGFWFLGFLVVQR